MMNSAQLSRLTTVQAKPWVGMLNYFRLMKADWDGLKALGYVMPRLLTTDRNNVEVWEYSITSTGLAALEEVRRQRKHA